MYFFRLFPTDTLFTSRASDIDYKFGSFVIPKGVDIRIPTFQLHRDKEFWSEPEKFNPSRFMGTQNLKAIDSVIFQPFGVGPRTCPGKRFGILEIKLILANILHKYRLIPGVNTEIGDIELDFKLITLSPKNGVSVKIVPRSSP
jgi:cytochrome P450